MNRFVLIFLFVFGFLLVLGFLGQPEAEQAAALSEGSSVLDGAVSFPGSFPGPAAVSYAARSGEQVSLGSAYPGFVYLYAEPLTEGALVEAAVKARGGAISASVPDAGLYLISVPAGSESSFLSSVYPEPWVLDGMPAFPLVPGSVALFDYFSMSDSPKDCYADHGDLAEVLAGRFGASTRGFDLDAWGLKGSTLSLAEKMGSVIDGLSSGNERVVFSFSLQSAVSGGTTIIDEERKAGCVSDDCKAVRAAQKLYYQTFLQVMEAALAKDPKAADRAAMVIIAGNAGADLDNELASLRSKFPRSFARMKVVGASDSSGRVLEKYNHLRNNSAGNMVYSLGEGVWVRDQQQRLLAACSGTSFAGPEVAAVLDYIWVRNPALSSGQLMSAFDKALAELGKDNVLPQDPYSLTTQAFLDRAVAIARKDYSTGTFALTIRRPGEFYGSFHMSPGGLTDLGSCAGICTTAFMNGTRVNVTATDLSGLVFTGWSGACAGTGQCSVLMDSDREVTMGFEPDLVNLTVIWSGEGTGSLTWTGSFGNSTCAYGQDGAYVCAVPYLRGAEVSLLAEPEAGSIFSAWSGACSGSGNCTVVLEGGKSVVAEFLLEQAEGPVLPAAGQAPVSLKISSASCTLSSTGRTFSDGGTEYLFDISASGTMSGPEGSMLEMFRSAQYSTHGLYYQGAQGKTASWTADPGLRFVTAKRSASDPESGTWAFTEKGLTIIGGGGVNWPGPGDLSLVLKLYTYDNPDYYSMDLQEVRDLECARP